MWARRPLLKLVGAVEIRYANRGRHPAPARQRRGLGGFDGGYLFCKSIVGVEVRSGISVEGVS